MRDEGRPSGLASRISRRLAPITEKLEPVLHVFGGHGADESQQSPHLLTHRELPLAGQNDAGV